MKRLLLHRIQQQLADLNSRNRLRMARTVDALPDGRCQIDGQLLINYGSNDYLGLAHELSSIVDPADLCQIGAAASALVTGRSSRHAELETAIAQFEATEAALLFPSGFAANLGVLSSLVDESDAVFCDRDNHASIVDAARSSRGKMLVYRRDRLEQLSDSLRRRRGDYQHVFIVTDGVFSMDGTTAPLRDLCDLAEQFDASVVVDEAHGTGVLGKNGRGACDLHGVEGRVCVRIGTMSKAMGGLGGFVAGDQPLIELLRNKARTQFFSTALPPFVCSAMIEALRIIRRQPERRQLLQSRTQSLREAIQQQGLTSIAGGVAPIVPIITAGDAAVVELSKKLQERGFFVPAIRSPTVAVGTERLRLSFGTVHSESDLQQVVRAIAELQQ